ncbi:MAG: 2-oxo acid dehydrogenase subunit E2 [Flavobacteriales bacterium]|nr:2-oxo acid dehydrogenase subunit E2 [Flavobacteriales bacterium]
MAQVEVILPKMGESVAEATITTWLKKEGDRVEAEEAIVEIATDKVDSEVPSPVEGTILKLLVEEGEVAQVGQAIALIGGEGDAPQALPVAAATKVSEPVAESVAVAEQAIQEAVATVAAPTTKEFSNSDKFYSPLVKSIAKTEGISVAELDALTGSGKSGRVTKKDILAYLQNRTNGGAAPALTPVKAPSQSTTQPQTASPAPAASVSGNVEIIEMDRMRKLIANHMVMSKQTSPHVTSFVEADVTNLVNWRNRMKKVFLDREGEKLTFTPIFIEAIVKAIKDFPMINISVDGDRIIRKKDINVGMAAALPRGNLIVPVIKNADRLNLLGITKSVNDLANRARNNQLKPDEISGGTYTLTNVGSFGNVMGTPIINQPEVAIMAVGAIQKKPAVIETDAGDTIGIRHFIFLSHSYDHRVVDGALGGMFVRRVADYLEQWDSEREI